MKELNTFREYLSEGKFKQGDMVRLKDDGGVGDQFAVISTRRMFGSNIEAVRVTDKEGKTTEYDETQLVMSMEEANEEIKEGTWGYGSKDQMIKALQILDKINDMGGVKGSLALDKYGRMLYNVFGDDTFHDAIDNAKDNAIDDDRFRNYIGDAMARGREMMNNLYKKNVDKL